MHMGFARRVREEGRGGGESGSRYSGQKHSNVVQILGESRSPVFRKSFFIS